jgi:predicted DNA-binding protein with PD1-like motif
MITKTTELKRIILLRLNPGEDLLLSLDGMVEKEGIQSAVILGGFGSVSKYHFHVVDNAELPPRDVFPKEDIPCDILSLTGLIIDGRVHAHITLSTKERALGGHLEEGCLALTFTVIYIGVTPDLKYTDWDQFTLKT